MRDIEELLRWSSSRPLGRRSFLKAAGGAAGLAALAACGQSGGTSSGGGGGTVTYLSASNFIGSWNPYDNLILIHMRAQRMVYDYLMWIDDNGNFVPGLATSLEPTGPTVWEAKLRKGVTFHDGHPFTAQDVKASIELASNPKSATGSLFPGQLQVEVVDDYTARIHTPEPFAALKGACLAANQSGAIISAADAAKGAAYLKSIMNGTGPFKMAGYGGEANGLHLTANHSYWRGKPKVENVYIKYVSDTSTRLAALQSGQADIVEGLGPNEAKALTGTPGVNVLHTTSTDSIQLAFRCNKAPFDNAKVRQAVAHAIDGPSIVKNIYGGYAVVNEMFGQPHTIGYMSDPGYPRFDKAKAQQLLAEAGFPGGNGLPTLQFLSTTGAYPKIQEISQFIVQNLQAVGIKVNLQLLDETAWQDSLFKSDGHMIIHGWLVPTPDRNAWYTSLFRTTGVVSFVSDPAVDAAIKAQSTALDPKTRADIVQKQLEPALAAAVPEFPIFTYDLITGVSSKIHGLTIPHWYEFDMFPVSKD
jgi:peptide/nickel transport system substrate-binding protein